MVGRERRRSARVAFLLNELFSYDELRSLSLELGIEFENLEGDTRREKAQSIAEYYYRRNDLDTLIHWTSGKRKKANWPKTKLD